MMNDFIHFWMHQGLGGVIRIFWFYFIFEFPRYLLTDFFFLSITFFNKDKNRKKHDDARQALWANRPLVTIIAPGKNEGINYQSLVDTLAEQTYQNFQLIVVDDGSDDETSRIGRKLEKKGLIDLFLRNEERGGKASAANLALRYARGEFVFHFDADCSFYRDAIEESLLPFYMDEKIGAVAGNLEVRNNDRNLCTAFQTIEYNLTITVARLVSSSMGILRIVSGAFGAFRRDALLQIGGWDVGPGLDGDITLKMRKMGYDIHFLSSAVAMTNVPENFRDLARQRLRWSRSLIRFRIRRHRDLYWPDENFRFSTFFSLVENIFFNFVLNILWFVYLFDIIFHFSREIEYVLIGGIILYTVSKSLEYLVVLLLTKRWRQKLKNFLFIPGMTFYTGFYIRIIRTIAYFSEILFKSSYNDDFTPLKSSRKARELDNRINAA